MAENDQSERIVERDGRKYEIVPCKCDNPYCNRPTAYDAETGEINPDLTLEVRGDDTGMPDDPEKMAIALILAAMDGDPDALAILRGIGNE